MMARHFHYLLISLGLVLVGRATSTSSFAGGFLATSLFDISASSTCGEDTPLNVVDSGQLLNCSPGEHSVAFSVDNNLNTWWQSIDDDDPAMITLTLQVSSISVKGACPIYHYFILQHDVSVTISGLRLHIRSSVPESYTVEVYGRNSSLVLEMVYVSNVSLCSQQNIACSTFYNDGSINELSFLTTMQSEVM